MTNPDDGIEDYRQGIGEEPILSDAELVELLEQCRKGDQEAGNKLIRSYLRFMVEVARKEVRGVYPSVMLIDLIHEGISGLMEAVKNYEHDAAKPFHPYVLNCIRQRILNRIQQAQPAIFWPPSHPPFPPVWDR